MPIQKKTISTSVLRAGVFALALCACAMFGAGTSYGASNNGTSNIPVAVYYNLPGLNQQHLKLNGFVLARIYLGAIRRWDDPDIVVLNPGVLLPHNKIIPVHRTDASDDTLHFTQYLSLTEPLWSTSISSGATVSWPALRGSLGVAGTQAMLTTTQNTPYAIAYIDSSYQDTIQKDGLGTAVLQKGAGN